MSRVRAGAEEVPPSSPPIPDLTEVEEETRCPRVNGSTAQEWPSRYSDPEEQARKEPGWFSRYVVAPTFRLFLRRREGAGRIDDQIHAMNSCPRLFISSICAALNWKVLEEAGITHIVVLGPHQLPRRVLACFKGAICYKVHLFPDDVSISLVDVLDDCLPFIKKALSDSPKNKVLVHCNAGHSRSASVCCAFLMQENKFSLDRALSDLRITRPFAQPNAGFTYQLMEMESKLTERD